MYSAQYTEPYRTKQVWREGKWRCCRQVPAVHLVQVTGALLPPGGSLWAHSQCPVQISMTEVGTDYGRTLASLCAVWAGCISLPWMCPGLQDLNPYKTYLLTLNKHVNNVPRRILSLQGFRDTSFHQQ